MKNSDLFDVFEEIDQDFIDDAMPEICRAGARRNLFKRIAAMAACFAVIIGGVLASKPFWSGIISPPISGDWESGSNSLHSSDDMGSNAEEYATEAGFSPIETEEKYEEPTEWCTEVCVPTLVTNYLGEQYQKYSFTSLVCEESAVGEKIDEIILNCNWSDSPDKIFECRADVYEVIGRDGKVTLCYKFSDDTAIANTEDYYYINNYSYSFDTIAQMAEMLGFERGVHLNSDVSYVKKTDYCYCNRYAVYGGLAEQLTEFLFSSESEKVEDRNLYFSNVHRVEERITLYFISDGLDSYFEVLANGYVYCASIGSHLFDVGAERAQMIIDLVKQGDPVGYVWNEENSEWYTICEEDEIRENPPKTFKEMLLLREAFNDFASFRPRATYSATKIKPAPPYFTLDDATLEYLIEFIYELDGKILSPYEEVAPAYECVELMLDNGSDSFEMHIFSAGYISFGGFDYFVGVEEVEKLISVVVFYGNPAPGYYWDEDNWCWQVSNSDETYPPIYDEELNTSPCDSIPLEDVETETMICEDTE